jgi:hypothetical protein
MRKLKETGCYGKNVLKSTKNISDEKIDIDNGGILPIIDTLLQAKNYGQKTEDGREKTEDES